MSETLNELGKKIRNLFKKREQVGGNDFGQHVTGSNIQNPSQENPFETLQRISQTPTKTNEKPRSTDTDSLIDPLDPQSKEGQAIKDFFQGPYADDEKEAKALKYVATHRSDFIQNIYSTEEIACSGCGAKSSSGSHCENCRTERPIVGKTINREKVQAALKAGGHDENILFEQENTHSLKPQLDKTETPKTGQPLSPDEIQGPNIPKDVIDAVNELIKTNLTDGTCTMLQNDIVNLLIQRGFKKEEIFSKHWLDFENIFRKAGWKVEYDKPGYNEDYEAFFTFSKKQNHKDH